MLTRHRNAARFSTFAEAKKNCSYHETKKKKQSPSAFVDLSMLAYRK